MDIEVGHLGADQEQRRASAVTDSVIHYLESDKSGGKSFLFVHYFDPHQPYDPPPEFASLYDNVGAPSPQSVNPDCCGYLHRDDNDPKRGNWPRLYAAEITYMDSEIGRLLDYLKSRGSYKNSIIILTSDHGEILWEHEPVFSHGRNVYESVIHTVCMIKLPGRKFRGTKCDRLSANIDVLPTLLHELRIPPPQGMDGEVLALDGTAGVRPESPRFSEATQPLNDIDIDPKWTNKTKTKCIRLGRYKYVMTPYAHTEEFYDLSADPCEQENLIQRPGALAETMNDLRSRLQAWNEQAAPLETHFERIQLEETVAKLTKLGYLEASSTAATSGTLPGHD
ncbi:sulfatase-like hydrolase/transferase [Candidatus Sumerlaeota bacterium]|nr:sulfatase-like hydrolase/transferase [Candidatus Sumerlaeota bacterium]